MKRKKSIRMCDWYNKVLTIKKAPAKIDYYNAGYNYFRSANYETAIPIFTAYSQKYPDDIFGYYMSGKSKWGIDTLMTQGLANPDFEKAISVGLVDSVKNKLQLVGSYKYFVAYYANVKIMQPLSYTAIRYWPLPNGYRGS